MIAFLCLFVSAVGFGAFLHRIDRKFDLILSIVVGYCLVPVTVFFSYFAFNHNLQRAFQLTMLLSVFGLFFFISDVIQKKYVLTFSDKLIFFIMILSLMSFAVFSQEQYVGAVWDEMTHWVLYPKQAMLNNSLLSSNFLPGSVTWYLPGLAFLNLFGEGVTGAVTTNSDYLYSQMTSTIFLVGIVGALTVNILKSDIDKSFLFFSLFFLLFSTEIYPVNNLIEVTQGHAILMLFALMYIFENEKASIRVQVVSITIVLTYAYLLKASNINLLPVVVLYYYLTSGSKKSFFKNVALSLGLVLVVYLLWKFYLQSSGVSTLRTNMTTSFFENLSRRSSIPLEFFKRLFTMKHFIVSLLISIPFVKYVSKKFTYLVYFYFATYIAGLLFLYLLVFGEFEGMQLASFDRYVRLALTPIKLHGLVGLVLFLCSKYEAFLSKKSIRPMLAVILLLTVGFNAYARFNVRAGALLESKKALAKYEIILANIEKVIVEHKLIKPRLLFVEQGSDGLGLYFINYNSLKNGTYQYLTSLSWSFNSIKKDAWTRVMSDEQFLGYVFEHELLALSTKDDWIDNFLKRHHNIFQCSDNVENQVLVKQGDAFICL